VLTTVPNKQAMMRGPQSSFGFKVDSARRFNFVRTGGQGGNLTILSHNGNEPRPSSTPMLEWLLQGSPGVSAKLHCQDGIFDYWISDSGWYRVDPVRRTIYAPTGGDELVQEQRLWGVPTLLCAMERSDFFLHAAAIELDKGAVLFAAPGRHGKTTLAMAFHQRGYRVLSEDSACCRLAPVPAILPGPALLRVRPDVFDGSAPAGSRIAAVYDERIYLVFDEDRRGTDDPVPVQALVLLRESANEIQIQSMPAQKALPDLWALSFRLPNDVDRGRCFKQLAGLAAGVPIWNLYRPLRIGSLGATVDEIVKAFG